jgi:hypothetical protein
MSVVVRFVSELCVEGPSRDTPEIGSLRLVRAHPCAQTVPRGALDTGLTDETRAFGARRCVSAVVPMVAVTRRGQAEAAA